jgi:hypothetical protein
MRSKCVAFQLVAVVLSAAILAYSQGNSFDKIRYNGGTIQTKVDPKDWGNHLTVTSEEIRLDLKDGQKLTIDPKRVYGLSYGQEAHRRVGTMIALGVLLAPLALFGLFHKTRLHFVGIEFTTEEGNKSGVLLQAHKDNYRAVLTALRGATGAPIAVAEEDRKFVPVGVEVVTAETTEETPSQPEEAPPAAPAPAAAAPAPAAPVAPETTSVVLKSNPSGAEVTVDGRYMGSTPSTLKLPAGDHIISILKPGFETWQRTISVVPGGEVTIDATLNVHSKALQVDDIAELLSGGVPETRLVQLVKERGVGFAVNAETEQKLREAGATDALMQAISQAAATHEASP